MPDGFTRPPHGRGPFYLCATRNSHLPPVQAYLCKDEYLLINIVPSSSIPRSVVSLAASSWICSRRLLKANIPSGRGESISRTRIAWFVLLGSNLCIFPLTDAEEAWVESPGELEGHQAFVRRRPNSLFLEQAACRGTILEYAAGKKPG